MASESVRDEIFQAVEEYLKKNYSPVGIGVGDVIKRSAGLINPGRTFGAGFGHAGGLKTVLDAVMKMTEKPFSERLMSLIEKRGLKASEIYIKAGITKQHFSKIKNKSNYQPSKETAIAFAIALHLTLDETKELIGSAGFALSKSSRRDLIVEYFIKEKIYDIDEINYNLYARGCDALTNKRNSSEK